MIYRLLQAERKILDFFKKRIYPPFYRKQIVWIQTPDAEHREDKILDFGMR
jgi:hypothetical protein